MYPQRAISSSLERTLTLSSAQQEMLKWLAITSMFVDHINQVTFLGSLSALSYFGRLAFPLFAFLIAYNIAKRGVAVERYVWPLLTFGIISQPVFVWAFGRSYLNIFFTLLLGVLYILVVRSGCSLGTKTYDSRAIFRFARAGSDPVRRTLRSRLIPYIRPLRDPSFRSVFDRAIAHGDSFARALPHARQHARADVRLRPADHSRCFSRTPDSSRATKK